ncbi:MAG: gliding motility lipoprotein GldD, partial [Bacteroidota bacterium]
GLKSPLMKRKMNLHKIIKYFIILKLIFLIFLMASCSSDYVPKPRGFFRIDLPEKKYRLFDTAYPFTFEYPEYARIIPDTIKTAEPYWLNLEFPSFNGQVNISYKSINNNLAQYAEDAYNLAMKHIPKADDIDPQRIDFGEHNVHGITYNITGNEAASAYQFFVTDSVSNFVRGALYFNVSPNNDSLAPVITFLKEDISHMIETLQWKKI